MLQQNGSQEGCVKSVEQNPSPTPAVPSAGSKIGLIKGIRGGQWPSCRHRLHCARRNMDVPVSTPSQQLASCKSLFLCWLMALVAMPKSRQLKEEQVQADLSKSLFFKKKAGEDPVWRREGFAESDSHTKRAVLCKFPETQQSAFPSEGSCNW